MSAQVIAAFAFGIVFIVTLITLAIAFPRPTSFQYNVFRIVLALAAAGVGAMIPGFIDLHLQTKIGLLVQAGGALAVFVIVFFFNPARLATSATAEITDGPQIIQRQRAGNNSLNLQAGRDAELRGRKQERNH